jgi:Na+-translocating ferredoxin:NAD+ oxidoreductase RNF subunit RnfB
LLRLHLLNYGFCSHACLLLLLPLPTLCLQADKEIEEAEKAKKKAKTTTKKKSKKKKSSKKSKKKSAPAKDEL